MSNQSMLQGSQKAQAQQQTILFTPPIKQPLQQITQKNECISTPSTGKKLPRSADYYCTPTRQLKSPVMSNKTVVNLSLRSGVEQDKLMKSLQDQIYQIEMNIKQLQKQNSTLLAQSSQSINDQINSQPIIVDQTIEISNNENILNQQKQNVTEYVNQCKEILQSIKQYEQQGVNYDDNMDLEIDKLNKGIAQQKNLQNQYNQHISNLEAQLHEQDSYLSDIRTQLQLHEDTAFEYQLMQQKIKLSNLLNEQQTYIENLEQQTNEIKEKQDYINQLLDSIEYKQYLDLQEEYEKQLDEQERIYDLSHYNNKLQTHIDNDLNTQIYEQELSNEQLIQRMIQYGENEGFQVYMNQMTFQDYLNQLSDFIRDKYKKHNEKFKQIYAEMNQYSVGEEANEPEASYYDYVDTKYNVNSAPETYNYVDDLYYDIYDENLYKVYKNYDSDDYIYNIDVSMLTTEQIEDLLKQLENSSISQKDAINYIIQKKKEQKKKKIINIEVDEEIEPQSEHDTIDDADDLYRDEFRYSLNDYDFY